MLRSSRLNLGSCAVVSPIVATRTVVAMSDTVTPAAPVTFVWVDVATPAAMKPSPVPPGVGTAARALPSITTRVPL